jgi:PRTRC genetic system ThiF family protein
VHVAEALTLDYLHAKPVVTRVWETLTIVLVGCGGTGSWLAPSIARVAYQLGQAGKAVGLVFVDPDTVEAANVPRQNFCEAEIGCNKAQALALRYGMAWGLDIAAVGRPYPPAHSPAPHHDELMVLVGCVDNAAARRSIAEVVGKHNKLNANVGRSAPCTWWLDCGNAAQSGQVLLGSASDLGALGHAFDIPSVCQALPSPAMQSPDLLEPLPEELADNAMSCAQIAAANAQSLMVNQAVAAVAADYLLRLVVTRDLRKFATYIDLPSGASKTYYTTPEGVARAVGRTVAMFDKPKEKGRRRSA